MSLTLSIKMKRFFFDRAEVRRRLGERKAKALGYFGGDVQRKGRSLIGKKAKRQKPRPPGKPPKAHVDDGPSHANLRKILFHIDPQRDAVIIGPVGVNGRGRNLSTGSVPALHEFGGTATVLEGLEAAGPQSASPVAWRTLGNRRPRPGQPTRTRRVQYPKRPFMRPAFDNVLARGIKRGKFEGLTVGPGSSAQIGPGGSS